MSTNKFTDEFKRDAVAQVVDRGYPVREVAERETIRPSPSPGINAVPDDGSCIAQEPRFR